MCDRHGGQDFAGLTKSALNRRTFLKGKRPRNDRDGGAGGNDGVARFGPRRRRPSRELTATVSATSPSSSRTRGSSPRTTA